MQSVWENNFSYHAQTLTICMKRNDDSRTYGPFTLEDVVTEKRWQMVFFKGGFDKLLGFDTKLLRNNDQDAYRELTSGSFASMNDALRASLGQRGVHNGLPFIGFEYVKNDANPNDLKRQLRRESVAMLKLADKAGVSATSFVDKTRMLQLFESCKFAALVRKSRRICCDLAHELNEAQKAREAQKAQEAQEASPVEGIPVPHGPETARVRISVGTVGGTTTNVSVSILPAAAPVAANPAPPQLVCELDDEAPAAEAAQEAQEAPAPAPTPTPSPTPMQLDDSWASFVTEDRIKREFDTACDPQGITKHGFCFMGKRRLSGKAVGKVDRYVQIMKGTRADRLATQSGFVFEKHTNRTLRSKVAIAKFFKQVASTVADVTSVE
jgi:hypothetical protein